MKKSSFVDYVTGDLLGGVSGVRSRAMFGGYGIYKGDTIFGIIVEDELYFKVGDLNRKDYEKARSEPFVYTAKGSKRVAMSYWKLPAEVMDDSQTLTEWTEKAIRVAFSDHKKNKAANALFKLFN